MERANFTGIFEVGTRVHCILYGGRDGVIYNIRGQQTPGTVRTLGGGCVVMGGSASFDIVWEDGTESKGTPECLVRSSVQWRILEGKADPQEIAAMIGSTILETSRREDERTAKAEAKAKAVAELKTSAKYAHLTQAGVNPKLWGPTLAAANIRAELKRAFPAVKFSVTSSKYSGGNSVDVRWKDGPTTKQVDAIANKYQAGWFDGMTDSYNYTTSAWNEVFGAAKFISTNRAYSFDTMREAVREVCFDRGWELMKVQQGSTDAYLDCCANENSRAVYEYLDPRD